MANASPTPSFALIDTTQKVSLPLVPQATNDGLHIVPTTEPLSEADITAMRRRIHEMGIVSGENGHASSREKEMADMVLRLTASSLIDPTQLLSQAATIAGLTSQRNFVIRQAEEERGRWQSERDGWDRTAEALIAQRNKPGNSAAKDEELERRCAVYESDNRALRDKLLDANNRLMTLESELNKLKPILLMQPYPRGDNHTNIPSQSSKHALARSKKDEENIEDISDEIIEGNKSNPASASASTSDIYKRRDAAAQHPYPYNHSYPAPRHTTVAPGSQQQPLPTASSRILWQPPNLNPSSATDPPRRVRSRRRIIPSLSSDARTEHLLLAARKIGRVRASVVSGLAHYADREKAKWVRDQEQQRLNREAERLEKERLERLASGNAGASYYRRDAEFASPTQKQTSNTPKRSGMSHYAPIITGIRPPRKSASQTTFVFVGNSGEPVGGAETATRRDATPRRDREEGANQKAGGGPPTPMDSLLSAARSMMDEGGKINGRRRAGPLEHPESPAPKKRRVAGSKGPSHGRAKSALDVLADQAAVANEAGSSSASAPRAGGKRASTKAKGKEKEKQGDVGNGESKTDTEDQQVMAKPKGRPKNSKKVAPTPVLVASGRKVRPSRAPPRDRTGNNNNQTSSNSTQTLRMISPPGPRIISAPDGHRGRMYSPLDEALAPLPSNMKGKEKAANREPEHVWLDSRVEDQRPSSAFSFGPVVGWGERAEGDVNDEHDGSSSPIMPEPSRPRYDPVLDAARVVESSSLQQLADAHPTERNSSESILHEEDHGAGSHEATSPKRMNGVAVKAVPSGSLTIGTVSQEEDQGASTQSLEGTNGMAVDAVESRSLILDVEKQDQSREVEVDAATVVGQNGVDGDKDEQRDKRNASDEQNDRNENGTEDMSGGNRLGDAHRLMNNPRWPIPLPGPPLRELDYDDEHDGDADAEGEIDPEASDAAQESAMAICAPSSADRSITTF